MVLHFEPSHTDKGRTACAAFFVEKIGFFHGFEGKAKKDTKRHLEGILYQ
jgi:hypothetical protein